LQNYIIIEIIEIIKTIEIIEIIEIIKTIKTIITAAISKYDRFIEPLTNREPGYDRYKKIKHQERNHLH